MTTKPFLFKYTRGVAENRAMYRLNQLIKNYRRDVNLLNKKLNEGEITPEEHYRKLYELTDKLDESIQAVNKEYQKEQPWWLRKMRK